MERNVLAMEAGNHETDDSDAKQKYEGQKQLNIQLMEQKRWLEHELEEIKLKIQNDKSHPLPDMLLDWDSLRWEYSNGHDKVDDGECKTASLTDRLIEVMCC